MLKGMGQEVRSHMSVVTPEMLEAITRKIDEEKRSSIEEVQRQKVKETQRKAEARAARQPPDTKEESKPRDSRTGHRRDDPALGPGASGPVPERTEEGRPSRQAAGCQGRPGHAQRAPARPTPPTGRRRKLPPAPMSAAAGEPGRTPATPQAGRLPGGSGECPQDAESDQRGRTRRRYDRSRRRVARRRRRKRGFFMSASSPPWANWRRRCRSGRRR